MTKKICMVSVLLLVSLTFVSPVSASTLSIVAPDTTPVNEALVICATFDGTPTQDVFIQFVPNNGIPIYAYTNGSGHATYKPLVMGSVVVRASYGSQTATKYVTVTTPEVDITTVNNTEITSGGATVTGNVTINGSEMVITTTPVDAQIIANRFNDTGNMSYDLPSEFEGATLDVVFEGNATVVGGEVTVTASKKIVNNPPKTFDGCTVDCDIEFPGNWTPENMTFSITPANMLNETVAEDIRDQVMDGIVARIKEIFGIDVTIDRSLVAPLAIKVTMDDANKANVTNVSMKMEVDKSSNWWLNVVRADASIVCMVKINETGSIIQTQYSGDITALDNKPSDGWITFETTFEGFSTYALVGYKSAPSALPPPSRRGGGGGGSTYPPGWFATPTVTATAVPGVTPTVTQPEEAVTTPTKPAVAEKTPPPAAEEAPTPEQVMEFRAEPPSLPPPILSPTAGIVIVAVAAIFGIVMVTRTTEDHKKATIATIGIVIVAVAAIIGMMLM